MTGVCYKPLEFVAQDVPVFIICVFCYSCLYVPHNPIPNTISAAFQASRPDVIQRQPLSALSMSSNANELVSAEL